MRQNCNFIAVLSVFTFLFFYLLSRFLKGYENEEEAEEDEYFINLTTSNTKVPSVPTTYWCEVVKMPDRLMIQKHHLIKFEPILYPHIPGLVHHIRLFGCDATTAGPYSGLCDKFGLKQCKRDIAAWGINSAGAFILPKEAGFPFGGPEVVPYYMIEIHYHNHAEKVGLIDNSGLKLTVTSSLRPYDAGVLLLGTPATSKAMVIPPSQRDFPLKSVCTKDCTALFPTTGLKIFGSELHAHGAATKVWTSIERDGKPISDFSRIDPFRAADQHFVMFDPPRTLMPGDSLTTVCVYDTTNRTETTFSGPGHSDEMCVNFLLYYPAVEVGYCLSELQDEALVEFFENRKGKTSSRSFANLTWAADDAPRLRKVYDSGPYKFSCLSNEGEPILTRRRAA